MSFLLGRSDKGYYAHTHSSLGQLNPYALSKCSEAERQFIVLACHYQSFPLEVESGKARLHRVMLRPIHKEIKRKAKILEETQELYDDCLPDVVMKYAAHHGFVLACILRHLLQIGFRD